MTVPSSLKATGTKFRLQSLLALILPAVELHTKWLNTLSYMEHIGATKIARTQSGPMANFYGLKHAAEEARHAFFLKKLILKLDPEACPTYEEPYLLAPRSSRQYLYRLDIEISRFLKNAGYNNADLNISLIC